MSSRDITFAVELGADAVIDVKYGSKGRRPSFTDAANPELGERLYEQFLADCASLGYPPQHGRFGADMKVESINDGPVTLILDTEQLMDTPRRK